MTTPKSPFTPQLILADNGGIKMQDIPCIKSTDPGLARFFSDRVGYNRYPSTHKETVKGKVNEVPDMDVVIRLNGDETYTTDPLPETTPHNAKAGEDDDLLQDEEEIAKKAGVKSAFRKIVEEYIKSSGDDLGYVGTILPALEGFAFPESRNPERAMLRRGLKSAMEYTSFNWRKPLAANTSTTVVMPAEGVIEASAHPGQLVKVNGWYFVGRNATGENSKAVLCVQPVVWEEYWSKGKKHIVVAKRGRAILITQFGAVVIKVQRDLVIASTNEAMGRCIKMRKDFYDGVSAESRAFAKQFGG